MTGSTVSISKQCESPKKGFTIIELLLAVAISSIAMFGLTVCFVAERTYAVSARSQAESQRDAEVVLRAIARAVRESKQYNGGGSFSVDCPGGGTGTRQFTLAGGVLRMSDSCIPMNAPLIDGVLTQSQVTSFTITQVTPSLVQIQIDVLHRNRENELLVTEVFLRNA